MPVCGSNSTSVYGAKPILNVFYILHLRARAKRRKGSDEGTYSLSGGRGISCQQEKDAQNVRVPALDRPYTGADGPFVNLVGNPSSRHLIFTMLKSCLSLKMSRSWTAFQRSIHSSFAKCKYSTY
jgi:hypothetical protein